MIPWKIFAVVASLLAIVGALSDLLLIDSERIRVRQFLRRHWLFGYGGKDSDMPKDSANVVLNAYKRYFGEKLITWKVVLVTLPLSFLLSVTAILLGRLIEEGGLSAWNPVFHGTMTALRPIEGFYNSQYLLPYNYVFDFATIITTVVALRLFVEAEGIFRRGGIFLVDLSLSFGYAVCALIGIKLNSGVVRSSESLNWGHVDGAITRSIETINDAFHGRFEDMDSLLFASTTFLPTFFYMFVLLLLTYALFTRLVVRKVTRRIALRLDINFNDRTFTRLTVFLVVVAATLNLIGDILS